MSTEETLRRQKANFLRKFTEAGAFTFLIILVIVVAGIVVGMETFYSMVEYYGYIIHLLYIIILAIFSI